jgi:hypothetical protein
VGDDVAKIFKEKEDSFEGGDIRVSRAGWLWVEVGITLIDSDEEVLVARTGLYRESASEVRGSPVRTRDSIGYSVGRKHAVYVVVRDGWVVGGVSGSRLGTGDRTKHSTIRESGSGVRNRRFCGGGTESLTYKVHVTTSSSNSNRRVTRHLLPIQTPYIYPPRPYSM